MTDHDRIKTALLSLGFTAARTGYRYTLMYEEKELGTALRLYDDGGIGDLRCEGDTAVSFLIALGSALAQKEN